MSNTVTDIAVLEAFDFSDCPGVSFGEAHQTPWRTDIPYPDGLRRALVHFQEIELRNLNNIFGKNIPCGHTNTLQKC